MRILTIIIAILALVSGFTHLIGGMFSLAAAIYMLTIKLPEQVTRELTMGPKELGVHTFLIAVLLIGNGLMFVVFALGTFKRKSWARILGISAYALNIIAAFLYLLVANVNGSLVPWIFGSIVAFVFIVILSLAKNAYGEPKII